MVYFDHILFTPVKNSFDSFLDLSSSSNVYKDIICVCRDFVVLRERFYEFIYEDVKEEWWKHTSLRYSFVLFIKFASI